MSQKKVVILNGARNEDDDLTPPFSLLNNLLVNKASKIHCYHLKEIKLAHCTGCFGCWVKTPGICVANDKGREIIQAVIGSDVVILFTPVTFGGYSSQLKIIVDRLIPLISPFFGNYHGKTHHDPRYSRYPRWVGIGVQRHPNTAEAELFKTLVGRNAINFHAPTFAADVINIHDDDEAITQKLYGLISRKDPKPVDNMASFFPKVDMRSLDNINKGTRNSLLLIGSPKIKHRSTSAILGEHVLEILKTAGCTTDILHLKASLNREKGQTELCLAVDRADLVILAFPLYIDALPHLVTRAFEVIATHNKTLTDKKNQQIFTIINNGFPEYDQNALALAICHCFAEQSGFSWAGSLAMGAGEALGGEQELTQSKRQGPPVKHVIKALDMAGTALAKGVTVPFETQRLISKSPIPLVSFGIWRWMFKKFGKNFWIQKANEKGVSKDRLYAKPYEDLRDAP